MRPSTLFTRTNIANNAYDNFYVTKIKYIIYNVQDYNFLYDDNVRPVISGVWHLLACGKRWHGRIISLRGKVRVHKNKFNAATFFHWSSCINPGKGAVMYLCPRESFVSSYDFYWIVDLFRQCGIVGFRFIETFYANNKFTKNTNFLVFKWKFIFKYNKCYHFLML